MARVENGKVIKRKQYKVHSNICGHEKNLRDADEELQNLLQSKDVDLELKMELKMKKTEPKTHLRLLGFLIVRIAHW